MPTCPTCGNGSTASFLTRYGEFPSIAGIDVALSQRPRIYSCRNCRFSFTFPCPDKRLVDSAYAASDTTVWPDSRDNAERRGYQRRIEIITKYAPTRTVLDIGCYTGEFLDHFQSNWDRFGIELSKNAADVARARGIKVIGTDIFANSFPERKFGAVVALNIIEHVQNPIEFIDKAVDLLADRGVLLIETGNLDSLFARVMSKFWSYYHLPEHVSFFSVPGLVGLMKQCGIEVIEIKRGLSHKRPRGVKSWLYHYKMLTVACLRSVLWRIFHLFSLREDLPLGVTWVLHKDHMIVVGRKVGNEVGTSR